MMVIRIKQHLSNIRDSIHEKVKQNWGWVEKKFLLKKCVFWDIVQIWKKFKKATFFIKFLSKVILNWNNENTENVKVAFLAGPLS